MDRVRRAKHTPEHEFCPTSRTPPMSPGWPSRPPAPGAPPPRRREPPPTAAERATCMGHRGAGTGASASRQQEDPLPLEVRRQLQQRFEALWCEEQVPALGGITPREAAADPSRRNAPEVVGRNGTSQPRSARGGRNYASARSARNARPAVEAALSSGAQSGVQFWRRSVLAQTGMGTCAHFPSPCLVNCARDG